MCQWGLLSNKLKCVGTAPCKWTSILDSGCCIKKKKQFEGNKHMPSKIGCLQTVHWAQDSSWELSIEKGLNWFWSFDIQGISALQTFSETQCFRPCEFKSYLFPLFPSTQNCCGNQGPRLVMEAFPWNTIGGNGILKSWSLRFAEASVGLSFLLVYTLKYLQQMST